MRQIILLAFIIIGSSFYINESQDIPKRSLKKIDKELLKLWEGVTIQKNKINSINKSANVSIKGHEQVYKLSNEANELLAYMMLSKAPGRYDDFDLMIVYDAENLNILSTSVLIYREEYGGEIGSKRWLKQFVGKNFLNTFKLDYEIQGISGATISVRSATKEIKRLSLLMKELQDNQLLIP